jgi:NitT/TauT family transport system permease protein
LFAGTADDERANSMRDIRLYSLLFFACLILGWEFLASSVSELVLPSPSVVLLTLWGGIKSGYLLPHLVHTSIEIGLGLMIGGILGFVAGILMGEVEFARRLFLPYVIASQAVPKLAMAPLFILWFGFGMTSKIVITALICFFPLLESTVTAIQYTDKKKLELFHVLRATRFQTLVSLKIPAGLPVILSGLRVAVVLAVVGAVVGEFIGGSKGLGALIIASQGMMDTPLMFAVIVLITLMGIVLYQAVNFIERVLLTPYTKEKNK